MLISSASFAQKGGSSDNSALGEANGRVDARSSEPNAAYKSVMYNPSISSTYKQTYQLGWARCRSSKNWQIEKGKLVYKDKTKNPFRPKEIKDKKKQ